ncbi:APC family permease [Nonlabens ulvanivorans]|uniref:Amino acid transporter n=1 Tax=Nonlabens ulvanivorans TaxID=906888 RepID=A0A084JYV2_NONUL|nr:APC family permease [Nonlabens ulvanivorans]KEZ94136.1 amino acid transporter [Nonlabens ulvanivorans]PRX13125.1 L-asparagine transporter-like permease [Nonlabens ulvanivorans]
MSDKQIDLKGAIAIGIGGMVGGGIFAVLGLAISLAKGATPVAFLIAGIIAIFTAYSYSKLSLAYPDTGGTVRFINEGFGKGVISGGLNNLLWISYIIMLALYASAFGSYAPNLITITGDTSIDTHISISAVVIIATIINYASAKLVSAIESYAVIIKLIILLGFIAVGMYGMNSSANLEQLDPSNWEGTFQIITGGMVIFVAYEGFELIANAVSDLKDPEKNIPRAYMISVLFVVALYITIAIITVGSLPFDQIKEAKDYVLSEVAKPTLGQAGFTIMTIAALISTFSAINATLYGGARVSYKVAEDDELPHDLTFKFWNHPIGLLIIAVATLLLANLAPLESISTSGSAGFLLLFAVVNYIAFKQHKKLGANKIITLLGTILCVVAFVMLVIEQSQGSLSGVIIIASIIAACFIMEYWYKRTEKPTS